MLGVRSDHPRRVVTKIEWRRGELFPRVGFIVTNLTWRSKRVVRFYNGRGTAEQWIKEGKNAVKWTKLSCRTFKDNQARWQLFALAYDQRAKEKTTCRECPSKARLDKRLEAAVAA